MSANFPFEVVPFTKEERDATKKLFTTDPNEWIRVGPLKYSFPAEYAQHAGHIYNMPLRKDDTFVVTFPRSGTTWTQELVWLLANNLDYEKAKATPLPERFPFVDLCMFFNEQTIEEIKKAQANLSEETEKSLDMISAPGYEILAKTDSPRFIKTHLPLSLLPPKMLDTCKVVYVARDPRDVAVSYYHFNKDNPVMGLVSSFEDYFDLFVKGLLIWCPFFEHVKEAWAQRHHPNMLFIFYEDLSKDLKGTACRISEFLGKSYSDEELQPLCEHLGFANFKKNTAVNMNDMHQLGFFGKDQNNFVRKGKSGGWREHFDEKLAARAQKWIDENLRDTDLRFQQ